MLAQIAASQTSTGPKLASSEPEPLLKLESETINGPPDAGHRDAWLNQMKRWRTSERERINYNGAEYERKDLLWTRRSLIQPQVMVEDRYLFDPVANKYSVNRYLDDLEKRYGRIDSVLL